MARTYESSRFFLFKAKQYSIVGIYQSLFVHLFIDGHLGSLHFSAVVNTAATNTGVQVSVSLGVCVTVDPLLAGGRWTPACG